MKRTLMLIVLSAAAIAGLVSTPSGLNTAQARRTTTGTAPAVFTCGTDFCKSKNAEAVKACKNNGGVESFSCDPTACYYSYSCRGIILP